MINHTPAKEKGLGYSLFQRYAKIHEKIRSREVEFEMPPSTNLDSMLMLTTQYRMVLTFFISLIFIIVIMFVNFSMIKSVNSHQTSFIMENLKQIHLC